MINFGAVKEINTLLIQQSKLFSGTWTIGTPEYMPDEQAKAHTILSSNVYVV
ncbi:hypothetical protein LC653_40150 [Nostoc sp. CHAB 5784]|uniref:hypothetical protein n=1 Tax=Nostoc mirabile TaxID=2907820 RepID=UPI001E3BE2B3|nr:hypothetical protein [Nostoc mirabile]MCC5669857.1 hypothetical protein [Nostoc mirabile CHAB5784]